VAIAIAWMPLLSCATTTGEIVSRARYLMGTECRIEGPLEGLTEEQIEAAFAEIARVEGFLSTWTPESELSKLNRSEPGSTVAVSRELATVLSEAMQWAHGTGGAFNPLVGPLVELWRLREEGALPPDEQIRAAAERSELNLLSVDLERSTVVRHDGAQVEEGGFGKGYALDRAVASLRSAGAASGLIDFGGQISFFGFDDGLSVSIAHPGDRQRAALTIVLEEGSVSTSSGSERTFEVNGVRFSHLIDPRNGRALPPRGSVTVVHPSGLTADILSTALYVLGPDEGLAWADEHDISVIFLVPAGGRHRVLLSQAVKFNVEAEAPWRLVK
jgi:thiamine biosynthesis lipoprotein